jgi:hypothetical protein
VVSNSTITNVSNEGLLEINNGQALSVSGTLSNSGMLDLDGASSATVLRFLGDLSLNGGGFVLLGSQNDQVTASSSSHRLTNVDNTIVGQGQLGMNVLEIRNESLIHASAPSSMLTVDPGIGGLANLDTMRASGGGILRLSDGTFSNSGVGVIEAQNSSRVEMLTANVSGGTLQTSGSGVIRVASSNLLNGLSNTGLVEVVGSGNRLQNVDNSGTIQILNAQTLTLQGGLTNSGGVEVTSSGFPTELTIDGNSSMDGGGSITLAGPAAAIVGQASSNRLTNVNNTITGEGKLGDGQMLLTNSGLIDASTPGGTLVVDLTAGSNVHHGTMRASGGGTLMILSNLTGLGDWQAAGGKIQLNSVNVTTQGDIAVSAGGELELNDASISGSSLTVDAGGIIDINSTVTLVGDLIFQSTDEADWSWGNGAALRMAGGAGATHDNWDDWSVLEVGGDDLGVNPETHVGAAGGFTSNFDLTDLVIGPDAHVLLQDVFDNGNRDAPGGTAEALYVDTLTFDDADGVLNLNGIHLYFNSFVGDPGQIIDIDPTAVPGDTNADDDVDADDLANLVAQFGGPPSVESADFNWDGIVDLDDFAIQRTNFGFGVVTAPVVDLGATTPEPATLIILLAGGLPLLRRRNRRVSRLLNG